MNPGATPALSADGKFILVADRWYPATYSPDRASVWDGSAWVPISELPRMPVPPPVFASEVAAYANGSSSRLPQSNAGRNVLLALLGCGGFAVLVIIAVVAIGAPGKNSQHDLVAKYQRVTDADAGPMIGDLAVILGSSCVATPLSCRNKHTVLLTDTRAYMADLQKLTVPDCLIAADQERRQWLNGTEQGEVDTASGYDELDRGNTVRGRDSSETATPKSQTPEAI